MLDNKTSHRKNPLLPLHGACLSHGISFQESLISYPIHFHFTLKMNYFGLCLCNFEGQKSLISIDSAKWINVMILQYPKFVFFASMPQIRTYFFLFLIKTKITQNKNKFLTTSLIGISRGQKTSFNMLKTVAINVFISKCCIRNLKKRVGSVLLLSSNDGELLLTVGFIISNLLF